MDQAGLDLHVDFVLNHNGYSDLSTPGFYDAGGAVLGSSLSVSDNESVTVTAPSTGTYVIRVWLYADYGSRDGNIYDMTIAY